MTARSNVLLEITDKPIIPEDVTPRVKAEECGAVVTFTGRVRGRSGDERVVALEHDATGERAREILAGILRELQERWGVTEAAICYRTGPVPAGEVTLVLAVATPHRPEAFAACQYAIDRFKQEVSSREILKDDEP